MIEFVAIHTNRDGYAPDQCFSTMTVGELKSCLDGFDDDTPVYFNNDNGYTYGSICEDFIREEHYKTDEEIHKELDDEEEED